MERDYYVFQISDEMSEEVIETLRGDLADDFYNDIVIHRHPRVSPDLDAEEDGFQFEWVHVLPWMELFIVGVHLGREREWDQELLDWLSDRLGSEPGEQIDTEQMADSPDDWIGMDCWESLSSDVRRYLRMALLEANEQIPTGAILHSGNAVERWLYDWYGENEREDTEDIWSAAMGSIDQEYPAEEAIPIIANLQFIHEKKQTLQDHADAIEMDDAISTIFLTRKTIRRLESAR